MENETTQQTGESMQTKPTNQNTAQAAPPQPPVPDQQAAQNQPPIPAQAPVQGQPPFPGQVPMQSRPPYPGQPPIQGRPPYPGQPPIQGQYPYPGQGPIQGQYPGQGPMQGQYPYPNQPPQYHAPNAAYPPMPPQAPANMPPAFASQAQNTSLGKSLSTVSTNLPIKIYDIPANVRKQYAKYIRLELYEDKMIGKGSQNGDITWYFKNYIAVQWTPASLASQFANLVFTTPEGAGKLVQYSHLDQALDVNRIMFCSGMYSYAPANNYVKSLYLEVKKVFDEYKAKESTNAVGSSTIVQEVSAADEIKKFKELLDLNIISQEEFDAKKKQLLGL